MGKLRTILTNGRVIILLACLLLGLFAIAPQPFAEGAAIRFVAKNSSAELAGIENPKATLAPVQRELIHYINNKEVKDIADYYALTSALQPNQSISIKTDKGSYSLIARPKLVTTILNETERITTNETREVNETINGTTTLVNKTVPRTTVQNKTRTEVIGIEPLGLAVDEAATSNLRKGLDLQGGARVVLKPQAGATEEQIQDTIDILSNRLNVFGLSDILITKITDSATFGGGNTFILVELAGANQEDVIPIINGTGKFEAKIGNDTVFSGGRDITYVCRTAQCSGLDPNRGCSQSGGAWGCSFQFSITLSPEAAQRQADLTGRLTVAGDVLSEQLALFLDDKEVDRLSIAADLKARAVTDIAITGGGSGPTQQQAMENTLENMKRLQTVLKSGALPVKLTIERIDNISPALGKEFLSNSFWVGMLSLAAVAIILTINYRRPIIILPIMFTAVSEIFLTIAVAAIIGWNIDLAAIAGIILAVGTGVNDQIIMTDEAIRKDSSTSGGGWKNRLKKAFFIIFSSSLATCVAMLPLLQAGAGLLKGFAITTMLAIAVGVLLTRPAYAAIVHILVEE